MRTLGAIILGVLIVTLGLYFAHFQDTDVLDILLIYYAGHGSQVTNGSLPRHTPLMIARAGDTQALEEALKGGGAWTIVASELALPPGLMVAEKALTDRLIETDDNAERSQLIATIREIRRYREFASRKQHVKGTSGAAASADTRAKEPATTTAPRTAPLIGVDLSAPVELKSTREEILESLDRLPRESRRLTTKERLERLGDDAVHGRESILISLLFGFLYVLCILAGIFSGSVYEALGKLDSTKPVKLRQVLRYARTAGTWQGIFAAPIVFTALVVVIPIEGRFSFAVAILAYQNGFFWRATLKRLSEAKAASNAPAA